MPLPYRHKELAIIPGIGYNRNCCTIHRRGGNAFMAIDFGTLALIFPLALLLGGCLISLPFSLRPLRLLFGNPLMKWLSTITLNYYLLHQPVAVQLKRFGIPPAVSESPNVAGEMPWQMHYTWLCFGFSIFLATLITLLIEKPFARLLKKILK